MKKIQTATLKKILKYVKNYEYLIALSIISATLVVTSTLYVPIIIGDAIDLILGKGNVDFVGIIKLLLRGGIIVVATSLLQWLMNTVNNKITYNVVRDVRDEAFKKIEILPLKYIDSHAYGETVSRVITDVDQFADGLLMGFSQLFTGVLTILGTLLFMLSINFKITLLVVLLTPVSLFVAKFIANKTYDMFKQQSETRGTQTAYIEEMIGNQKIVAAFSHEDESAKQFDSINNKLEKCYASIGKLYLDARRNDTDHDFEIATLIMQIDKIEADIAYIKKSTENTEEVIADEELIDSDNSCDI